jgi:hypothetical protein
MSDAPKPKLIMVPVDAARSSVPGQFRFTAWELQDLVRAVWVAIQSERLPEDEHERVVELEKTLMDMLRTGQFFNREAVVEFRPSTDIQ